MIRRLIILLLIVGCVFGDTIVYERALLGFKEEATILKATIIKIENGELWYTQKSLLGGKQGTIPCEKIVQLINSDNREIEFDCVANTYQVTEFEIKKHNTAKLGAIFISIGGAILFTNLDKRCDDCELTGTSSSAMVQWANNVNDFENEVINTQRIGYVFIILGGLLIALDN
jgi:hypothetical protein